MPKRTVVLAWRVSYPRHKAIDVLRRAIYKPAALLIGTKISARVPESAGRDGRESGLVDGCNRCPKSSSCGAALQAGSAAAMLRPQHLKPELCEIELIESEEIGTIGVGEFTVPPFVGVIQRLGIDEQEFIRRHRSDLQARHPVRRLAPAAATPISIRSAPSASPSDTHDFYQCWLKASHPWATASSLQDFSPCNIMAENGRFFPPARARNTPIGGANYALHVDAAPGRTPLLRDYSGKLAV